MGMAVLTIKMAFDNFSINTNKKRELSELNNYNLIENGKFHDFFFFINQKDLQK